MKPAIDPSSQQFFEQMYVAKPDPWSFATSDYELSRYDALVAALDGRHFARAFEPGCSVGVLTARLAPLCGYLLATDISASAVASARQRCAEFPNVSIEQGSVTDANPGPIDLLILSEIGYYSDEIALKNWADRLLSLIRPGGTLLAAHWLGVSPDHRLSGNKVHSILHDLAAHHRYSLGLTQHNPNFRLDLWRRDQ